MLLPTGKGMTATTQPVAEVGSLPMNIAVTGDGRYAVTTDIGALPVDVVACGCRRETGVCAGGVCESSAAARGDCGGG